MSISTKHHAETYPGEYHPPYFDWDDLMKELSRPHEGSVKPTANVSEEIDHYKVEIAAPGHNKEDFIVGINNTKLSIVAKKPAYSSETKRYRIHEFNFECFSHLIDLPEDIDPDFVRAEYRAGILAIYFPKISEPTINMVHRIIVY